MASTSDPSDVNLPPPTFDLDSWASNYEGALLPYRLAHIAQSCPSLAQQAIALALAHAKSGKDVQLYHRLTELANRLGLQDLAVVDTEWVARKDEENRRELSRLESELRGYKNNLIRESIRMGQEDLATHLLLTGGPAPDPTSPQSVNNAGLHAAYQSFGRMRDYCNTPTHVNSMSLRLIFTALLQAVLAQSLGNSPAMHLNSVHVNASRLRGTGVKEEEQCKLSPISFIVSGIAHMSFGEYRAAAADFLHTPFDYHNIGLVHGWDFERLVASANDVAIYGGLCALATMSREELMDSLLAGPFRAFLEQEPHMRKAIVLYTTAKYQACIDTLQRYHSDWSLDIFLGARLPSSPASHVNRLFARIRERSITAHFSSFSQISLASLASTFPPASDRPDAMEREVLAMIERKMLDARLDVVNGILLAPQRELRRDTYQDARSAAEEVERTLLLRLHRVNMTMAGLEISKSKFVSWDSLRAGNGY